MHTWCGKAAGKKHTFRTPRFLFPLIPSLLFLFGRDGEIKRAALPDCRFHPDPASVPIDNPFADRKTNNAKSSTAGQHDQQPFCGRLLSN